MQEQKDINEQEEALHLRYSAIEKELQALRAERDERLKRDKAIALHIRTLKRSGQVLTEWDDTVWMVMVEKAIVHKDKSITFKFYNGSEIWVGA